jgi:hypothetical protein
LGINPLYLIGGAEILSGLGGSQQQSQPALGNAKTEAPSDEMGEFESAMLGSTEVCCKEISLDLVRGRDVDAHLELALAALVDADRDARRHVLGDVTPPLRVLEQ